MSDSAARPPRTIGRWALAALAAGLAAVWLGRGWWAPVVVVDTVLRRDLVQTVVASGRVETPHRVDVGAQITATVTQVPVAEGQAVRAGQVLVQLDSAELQAALRSAELAVAQAQGRLRQLRDVQAPVAEQAVRQAQAALDNARGQWQRQQALFRQGFIGQAALDEARRALDTADAQQRSARQQFDSLSLQGSDRALAEVAVAQAHANAEAARARLRYATLVAPVAGTLISRNVEVGDVVQPGKLLLTLSPAGRTQLVVAIDEKNLRLLALGQPALASADADPQQRFAATLAYINPGVNAQTGAVDVKLDVPAAPPQLKQDMTVSVDIEVARRPAAVLLPVSALRAAASAQPWVLRLEEGRAVRRVPRLGLRSGGWAEVLEGLAPGDQLVPTDSPVADGGRLRASPAPAAPPTALVAAPAGPTSGSAPR